MFFNYIEKKMFLHEMNIFGLLHKDSPSFRKGLTIQCYAIVFLLSMSFHCFTSFFFSFFNIVDHSLKPFYHTHGFMKRKMGMRVVCVVLIMFIYIIVQWGVRYLLHGMGHFGQYSRKIRHRLNGQFHAEYRWQAVLLNEI